MTIIKRTLFWILCFITPLLAGVPEPGLTLYGVVECGGGSVRLTSGEITMTLSDPEGNQVTVSSQVEDLNKVYSYALQVPFETVVYDMASTPNTFELHENEKIYKITNVKVVVDNKEAVVLMQSLNEVTMSQSERGKIQRLDIQLEVNLKDSDGDGMPDAWEEQHGLNPYENKDDDLDSDGDGRTNVQEYHDGTDPQLPNSEFSFTLGLTDHPTIGFDRTLTWAWNSATSVKGMDGYEYRLNSSLETDWVGIAKEDLSLTLENLNVGRNQTLELRVKVWAEGEYVYSTPEKDSFGIDASSLNLVSMTLENQQFATDQREVQFSLETSSVGNNEIKTVLVKVNEGDFVEYLFSIENNYTIELPDVLGFHQVFVKAIDQNDEETNVLEGEIYLTRHINHASIVIPGVDEAELVELRGGFTISGASSSDTYSFNHIPDGLYGLLCKNGDSLDASNKRFWIKGGQTIDLGTYSPSSGDLVLNGLLSPKVEGMEVRIGKDLGWGYFLPLQKSFTDENGDFSFSHLSSGTWTLQARDVSGSEKWIPVTQSVDVTESSNNQITLSLEEGFKVSGTVSGKEVLVGALDEKQNFYPAFVSEGGTYSINLKSGDYTLLTFSEIFESKSLALTVDGDLSQNLDLEVGSREIVGSILQSQTLVDPSLSGLLSSLQVLSKESFEKGLWVPHFEVLAEGSTLDWGIYSGSTHPAIDSLLLTQIIEDKGQGIFSLNLVNASSVSNDFTIQSAGGHVKGSVIVDGQATHKPIVKLFDGQGELVGWSKGGSNGSFLYRNLTPGLAYQLKTTLTNGIELSSEPFEIQEGDDLTVDLSWSQEVGMTLKTYSQEIEASENASVEFDFENLPEGENIKFTASLINTSDQQVYGQGEVVPQGLSGSLSIVLQIDENAPPSNVYQFKVLCKKIMGNEEETLKVIQSPNDVILKGAIVVDPILQLKSYDLQRKAGETYHFKTFMDHIKPEEMKLLAQLVKASSEEVIVEQSFPLQEESPGEKVYDIILPENLSDHSNVLLKLSLVHPESGLVALTIQTDSHIKLFKKTVVDPGSGTWTPDVQLISSKKTLRAGERATIYIQVQGEEVYGVDSELTFDRNHLIVKNVNYEEFFPSESRLQIPVKIIQSRGWVKMAASLMNPAPAKSGKGIFASVTLEAKEDLDVETTLSCDVVLSDRSGNKIVYERGTTNLTLKSDNSGTTPQGDQSISGTIYHSNGKVASGVKVTVTKMEVDPVTGLLVVVENADGTPVQYEATTDENGNFVVDQLPELEEGQSYEVKAETSTGHFISPILVEDLSDPVVIESVELILGDINQDEVIDIGDFTVMASAYGLKRGQNGYRSQADLNKDQAINIQDLTILGGNFGMRS